MSYILDALLKAEQERQRAAVPSLQSVASYPAETRSPPPPRSRLALLSIAVALGAAGLAAIVLQRPWTPAASPPAAAPAAATVAMAPTAPIVLRPPAVRKPPSAVTADNSAPPTPVAAAPYQPAIAVPAVTQPTIAAPAPRREPNRQAKAPLKNEATTTESTVANRERILDISELPAALRQEVDKNVVVSGLSLSPESGEQLAIINDRARHTGDDIIAGMTLERIQPDGVILRYKGYRFRRGLY